MRAVVALQSMDKTTQAHSVLEWLIEHPFDGLTARDASYHLGCDRLAAVIWSLRNLGVEIETEYETKKMPNSRHKTYARYKIGTKEYMNYIKVKNREQERYYWKIYDEEHDIPYQAGADPDTI